MTKYILGCDPGLKGALAFYSAEPLDIIIYDMPVDIVTVNGKKKSRINIYELSRIIDERSGQIEKAVIENVSSSPQMGVTSAFSFGLAFGILQGVIASNFIPMELVRPQAWKKCFSLNSDKSASRIKASHMFPSYASEWSRCKDDGRSEALLMAVYGSQHEKMV